MKVGCLVALKAAWKAVHLVEKMAELLACKWVGHLAAHWVVVMAVHLVEPKAAYWACL